MNYRHNAVCPFLGAYFKNVSSRCPVKASSGLLCKAQVSRIWSSDIFYYCQQIPYKKESSIQYCKQVISVYPEPDMSSSSVP